MSEKVHEKIDGWYFWDEIQAGEIGPFRSEAQAIYALKDYSQFLDSGDFGKFNCECGEELTCFNDICTKCKRPINYEEMI